jgi:hypothetical protein
MGRDPPPGGARARGPLSGPRARARPRPKGRGAPKLRSSSRNCQEMPGACLVSPRVSPRWLTLPIGRLVPIPAGNLACSSWHDAWDRMVGVAAKRCRPCQRRYQTSTSSAPTGTHVLPQNPGGLAQRRSVYSFDYESPAAAHSGKPPPVWLRQRQRRAARDAQNCSETAGRISAGPGEHLARVAGLAQRHSQHLA